MTQHEGRDETSEERLDRKLADQLQELRVMQTGVQLTAGFLLTLPFQSAFGDLDTFQRTVFLVLMCTAAFTTLCVVTPVSVHRRLTGERRKERVVATAQAGLVGALVGVGVLVAGILTLIFDVVVGRTVGLVVGGTAAVAAVVLLAVVPHLLARDD